MATAAFSNGQNDFGGAFLCDGVGLGKTFIGLMLIERFAVCEKKAAGAGAREPRRQGRRLERKENGTVVSLLIAALSPRRGRRSMEHTTVGTSWWLKPR